MRPTLTPFTLDTALAFHMADAMDFDRRSNALTQDRDGIQNPVDPMTHYKTAINNIMDVRKTAVVVIPITEEAPMTMAEHVKSGWGEDPDYPRCDWEYYVSNGDTNLGYWEHVAAQVEAKEMDAAIEQRIVDRSDTAAMRQFDPDPTGESIEGRYNIYLDCTDEECPKTFEEWCGT